MNTPQSLQQNSQTIPLKKKIGFGIADIGGNIFFTVMGFWTLTYLTDTVYLNAALAGTAVMASKFWDAVTDPVVGYLSDRTQSRWGRRRPYLLFGALPFGFFFWYFFTAPPIHGQTTLFWWALLSLCILNTAMTCVNIPYTALTPELTHDYTEQTSLNAYRFTFAGVGTLFGAVIMMPIVSSFSSKAVGFSVAAGIIGAIITITTLITFFSVKEPVIYNDIRLKKESIIKSYRTVFKNKAYGILLTTFVLHITALNFLQGMIVYYLKYVHGAEAFSGTVMGILLLTAIASIPIAAKVSNRYGKYRTYQIGFGIIGISALLVFFIGHRVDIRILTGLFVLAGIGIGFCFATPWAMLPDVITQSKNTAHNEGCYYGVWTFTSKLGQALSVGISGILLHNAGYAADAVQNKSALLTIRILAGPIPAVICLAGIIMLYMYHRIEKQPMYHA